MTKKNVLSFIILLIAIVAFMLVPKEKEIEEDTQPTTTQSTETSVTETDDGEQQEEKKETFGGIRIGTSNLILLVVLGSVLAVNKVKEIKAGQSQEKD